ncbi:MAG: PhoB family transcriptional regulator [Novosphingobium sp.]|nr:PhoB family transcriptional regulator [Novosphingobium sp.]
MSEPGTVILTNGRPEVLAELLAMLADRMPSLRVLTAGSQAPVRRMEGRTWCFVDWLLPDLSGLEMCRRLRDAPATAHSHITMILDDDDTEARRRALRAGADDYVLAPLTADLLLDRLKRHGGNGSGSANGSAAPPRLAHGSLTLDLSAHQARWQGRAVPLRPNEFRLLAHFIEHPDQVLSRTGLIGMLGKDSDLIDERTVDVWVGRLRRGLKAHGVPDPLRTVRSLGYVLDSLPD